MKKGKYSSKRSNKSLVLVLALVMLLGCVTGGTLAWLTAQSDPVENTFAPSTIGIKLTETEEEYKMIPGWTIHKDPVVTVKANSEDCWVFIQVNESENLSDFIEYKIDDNNWTKLENVEGVYYCYAKDIAADRNIKVLLNNQVTVRDTVTKQMMDGLAEKTRPTLTFTAYASQLYKNNTEMFEPLDAWKNISGNP